MRRYYEELWQELPERLEPPDRELRLDFMRAQLRPGERVLDLGCGDGWATAEMARLGAVPMGVEVAAAALQRARRNHPELEFRLAEIDGELPLPDNALDVVWASEVIEHVADTARWLSEVRRVLRAQGRLLLTTPSHSRLRLLVAGIELYSEPLGDHLHLYSARSLRGLLADFGFVQVELSARGGPPLARRMLCA
ncbi:MAG TPA: class I SAM-dependent methyltransferase, partial [Solirubrobacteraceae bacterium]|nr:class I SAM-dependent methyltransferase [Solirubrobacteraceae bacterium]